MPCRSVWPGRSLPALPVLTGPSPASLRSTLARRTLLIGAAACATTAAGRVAPARAQSGAGAPMPTGLGASDPPPSSRTPLPIDLPSEAPNALPVPPSDRMAFQLLRRGTVIGTHALDFARTGDMLRVTIAVDVVVRFLGLPIVRYTHHNVETWDRARLVGLSAVTDRNGEHLQMGADMTQAGLAVHGSRTRPYIAPPDALGTTYWNARMLLGPMIGTQDGQLVHPAVSEIGLTRVPTVAGQEVECRKFTLRGRINSDVWYDLDGAWTSMSFAVTDGSLITYRLL